MKCFVFVGAASSRDGRWVAGFGFGYPVYPPYWGPYAYRAGFAVGVALGAGGWGCCWHGSYNVTINNVYNYWGSGTVTMPKGTYHHGHAGHVTAGRGPEGNTYAGRNGNVYRKENGQWQRYQNGSWNNVNTQQAKQRASDRANTARQRDSGLQGSQMSDQSLDRMQSMREDGENRFSQFRSDGGFSNFQNSDLANGMRDRFGGDDHSGGNDRFGGGNFGGDRWGGGQLRSFRGGGFGGFGGGFRR